MPKKTRLRRHGHVTRAERRSPTNARRAHRISPHTMQHEQRHATTAHDATTTDSHHCTSHSNTKATNTVRKPRGAAFRHNRRNFHGGSSSGSHRLCDVETSAGPRRFKTTGVRARGFKTTPPAWPFALPAVPISTFAGMDGEGRSSLISALTFAIAESAKANATHEKAHVRLETRT